MSENLDQQTPAQPPTFPELVQLNLEKRGVKPRCQVCACIGWANFEILPVPSVTPTLAQNLVVYSAVVTCLKCGLKTEHNLNVLGMPVQFEQRRVLTPSELAQQQPSKPLIVTG